MNNTLDIRNMLAVHRKKHTEEYNHEDIHSVKQYVFCGWCRLRLAVISAAKDKNKSYIDNYVVNVRKSILDIKKYFIDYVECYLMTHL